MVRNYKRTSTRCSYGEESLKQALVAIKEGVPLRSVAKQFNIPPKTLRRHRDEKVSKPGKIRLGRFRTDLPEKYEEELVRIIQKMERELFGLTTKDVRRLAFDFAEKMGVQHRFLGESRMAGIDWLHGFLKRHPQLSIRKANATSVSTAVGCNPGQVNLLFMQYQSLLSASPYNNAGNVWHMDETEITTVQKPGTVAYGCGVCDSLFVNETKFLQHCRSHQTNLNISDTFCSSSFFVTDSVILSSDNKSEK